MLRFPYLFILTVATMAALMLGSCDRMTGDVIENQLPVVQFVNVPLDSSSFSFAPTVYWFGYDPDGFVTAYQYADDQSPEALAAYNADRDNPGTLLAYINSLPAEVWRTTENTQETIYLLTTEGDTTQHVFIVRSVDNHGATSIPRVRAFFRTNQAPNAPQIKKMPTDQWDEDSYTEDQLSYHVNYVVDDTLFIGNKSTATWPGLQFVWKGTDPDSRELNIIPLEFSYRLNNLTTNQVLPFPRIVDSTRTSADTMWIYDWSDWKDQAQLNLSEAMTHGEMETGNYLLELRVRDDGLTLADTNATATFYAIRPSFDKQLLIIDENKPLTGPIEPRRGGYSDSLILAFYYSVIPQAFEIAEAFRPNVDDDRNGIPDIQEPFVYDTSDGGQVRWFRNKNMESSIPLDIINQFKWVWIIDDDNPQWGSPGADNVKERQRAMGRYLNVGGQLMISGRRILTGSYGIGAGDNDLCAANNVNANFFCTFFNLASANAKSQYNSSETVDFGGATTANPLLPDVVTNPAVVCSLRWTNSYFCCLPEIDFIGRSTSSSGYDFSETLYNYTSCTDTAQGLATNIDCDVIGEATPTQALLEPAPGHTRILQVTRVFNVTRNVYGEVMGIRNVDGTWQIVVSTPEEAGAWVTEDTLQVDYSYIPISINHDKPVAARFIRIEGTLNVDQETGQFEFVGETRFRTAIFTFPLSFLDPTPVPVPAYGTVNPAAAIVASQLLFFNSIKTVQVGRGEG